MASIGLILYGFLVITSIFTVVEPHWKKWRPEDHHLAIKLFERKEMIQRQYFHLLNEYKKKPMDYENYENEKRKSEKLPRLGFILSYDGGAFSVEILVIIFTPIIISFILGICANFCRAYERPLQEIGPKHPPISINKLQQTKLEQKMSQTRQIGVDWYAKKFVIRANDEYVDIDSIMENDRKTRNSIHRFPWRFARLIPKWISWYLANLIIEEDAFVVKKQEIIEDEEGITTTERISNRLNRRWKP